MHHIEQRSVIFINQHHHLLPGLLIGFLNENRKAVVSPFQRIGYTVKRLIFCKLKAKILLKLLFSHVLAKTHVEVQHREFFPLFFKFADSKTLE